MSTAGATHKRSRGRSIVKENSKSRSEYHVWDCSLMRSCDDEATGKSLTCLGVNLIVNGRGHVQVHVFRQISLS